jgi:hypothetical protein
MIKPIHNWRDGWRFTSVQALAVAMVCDTAVAAIVIVGESWPVSPIVYVWIRLGLTVISMAARFVAQESRNVDVD